MKLSRKIVPVSCNYDCISGCPLEAVVEEGRVVKVRNSRHRKKYMRGCVRGFLSPTVLHNQKRLRRPLIRTGARGEGEFREAGWDEALDLVARRLEETRRSCGPESILRLGGGGACRGVVHNTASLTRRFLSLFGGCTEATDNFSSAATDFVKPHLFGTEYVGIDVKTLLSSKLILLWGFNAADTRFGSETGSVLDEARGRGIPIIVIDPRKTRSVERFSADWLPIFPGSDAALMTAMLYLLLEDGRIDRDRMERFSVGFDRVETYVMGREDGRPKGPEWGAACTGLSPETIRDLTRRYAEAQPAALLPGLSIQRTLGGEEADRMAAVLQLAAGNLGVPGGSAGAGQWNTVPGPRIPKIPVPENPAQSSIPVYRWADTVLDPAEGPDIRALYSVGGNYAVQASDIKKNLRALRKVDFSVSQDPFLTETGRWCDVVLPAATFLERRDVVTSHSNYLFYSERAIELPEGVKTDYAIFAELAERLGFGPEFTGGRDADGWVKKCVEESEVEDVQHFIETGLYEGEDQSFVGLADFIRDPEVHPLNTPSGKIEFHSESFAREGGSPYPKPWELSPDAAYPLRMITPHAPARVNSQFHDSEELERLNDDRIWMHPRDAGSRGIVEKGRVLVESEIGRMYGTVRLTRDILPGVVSCNQGVWPLLSPQGEDLAGSVNILTSTEPTMPSRGSRTHSLSVEIWNAEEN